MITNINKYKKIILLLLNQTGLKKKQSGRLKTGAFLHAEVRAPRLIPRGNPREIEKQQWEKMALISQRWGYVRIITGTIVGGILGFYVMYRVEISYKVIFSSLSIHW